MLRVWVRCAAIRTSAGDDRLTSFEIWRDVKLEMLQRAAAVLRPGGRIIYATCSSEPEEDEDVVTAFLSSHRGLQARARTCSIGPDGIHDARRALQDAAVPR